MHFCVFMERVLEKENMCASNSAPLVFVVDDEHVAKSPEVRLSPNDISTFHQRKTEDQREPAGTLEFAVSGPISFCG
jgi:hypothetical protein